MQIGCLPPCHSHRTSHLKHPDGSSNEKFSITHWERWKHWSSRFHFPSPSPAACYSPGFNAAQISTVSCLFALDAVCRAVTRCCFFCYLYTAACFKLVDSQIAFPACLKYKYCMLKEGRKGGRGSSYIHFTQSRFQSKETSQGWRGCNITIEGLNLQEDATVFDTHTPDQRAARETHESKTTGDCNSLRQKWTAQQATSRVRQTPIDYFHPTTADTPASQAYVEYSPRPNSGTWNIP